MTNRNKRRVSVWHDIVDTIGVVVILAGSVAVLALGAIYVG